MPSRSCTAASISTISASRPTTRKATLSGELRIVGLFTSTAYTRSVHADPLSALQGRSGHRQVRLQSRRPLRQGADQCAGVLSARRAVPGAGAGRCASMPQPSWRLASGRGCGRWCASTSSTASSRSSSSCRATATTAPCARRSATISRRVRRPAVGLSTRPFRKAGWRASISSSAAPAGKTPKVEQATLEAAIRDIVRTWEDGLREAAAAAGADPPPHGDCARGCPKATATRFSPADGAGRCRAHRQLISAPIRSPSTIAAMPAEADQAALKIYHFGARWRCRGGCRCWKTWASASSASAPSRSRDQPAGMVFIHDMELENSYGKPIDLDDGGALFEDASCRSGAATVTMTAINGLAQTAGLWSGEITHPARLWPLSAAGRHPAKPGFHRRRAQPLSRHRARPASRCSSPGFDPTAESEGVVAAKHLKAKIKDALEDVPNIDDDTIIRALPQPDRSLAAHQSFRCRIRSRKASRWRSSSNSQAVDGLPAPRPGARSSSTVPRSRACICASARWRAAACAGRTAPRTTAPRCSAWSRRSRSRTPSSCRSAPRAASSRSACRSAAAATRSSRPARRPTRTSSPACCRSPTISALDGVVPPAGVVRRDGDDPYFVVAADKGTATFSDTANAISEKHGFWLDDAFASGGSAGYDHKKMGITAKGAWEAVKRHFREIEPRHPDLALHRRRRRRHVGRRVRQRHAVVADRRG